jgi:hypothetical protein
MCYAGLWADWALPSGCLAGHFFGCGSQSDVEEGRDYDYDYDYDYDFHRTPNSFFPGSVYLPAHIAAYGQVLMTLTQNS